MKALIVDDDRVALLILGELLKSLGFEIITAVNGQEGLALFEKSTEKKEYEISLVLTDGQMPIMDGLEMTERIRIFDSVVPIIIISGLRDNTFRDKVMKSGVNVFLEKPFKAEIIKETIFKLMESKKA